MFPNKVTDSSPSGTSTANRTPAGPASVFSDPGRLPATSRRCAALMYHYVRPAAELSDGVRGLTVTDFARQLDELGRVLQPIDFPTMLRGLGRGGEFPADCFVLTFDDGLSDHRRHVAQLLEERRLRGVFFVPGITLGERRILPAHAVHLLLTALGEEKLEEEIHRGLRDDADPAAPPPLFDASAAARPYHYETPARARIKYLLHMVLPLPRRNELVSRLFERHVGSAREWADRLYLTADDVCDLQRRGHTIGAHGHEHEPLTRMSAAGRRADLRKVSQLLNATLGPAARPLSFPFGAGNADTCAAAAETGFAAAFSTEESLFLHHANPLWLPRIDAARVPQLLESLNATGKTAWFETLSVPERRPRPEPAAPATKAVETPPLQARAAEKRDPASALLPFLNAFWLRPENAVWMTLRSEALRRCAWERPSADLCCGDGLFSFLHHGGRLDPDFDVFQNGCNLQAAANPEADMFDHATEDYRPAIAKPADGPIDDGSDYKPNLLAKARALNLYAALTEHDHNRPLPFAEGRYRTVYCNAAYWIAGIDSFLAELRRIVHADGRVILQVKLDTMRKSALNGLKPILGPNAVQKLAGDRLASWPTLADRRTWEARFARAGFHVESALPLATALHATLWDVGLRPVAPLIARLANATTPQTRAAVKRDWVALFAELAAPLCDPALSGGTARHEPVEIQYVLRLRGS
jgi:peptidoglycan/xylan/chitin deacetylase (PgdA/CDA1 family)